MTDINKQIEEERILDDIELEALKYARQEYPNSTKPIQAIVAGDCSRFAKQILHSSRWRKVSEGLPEIIQEEHYWVNVKHKNGYIEAYNIATINDLPYLRDNCIEWKPID